MAILMIIVFSALLFSSVHLNKTSMFCSTTIHKLLPCKKLKFAFLFSSLSLVYAIQDSIILFNSNPHIAILVNAYLCSRNNTCKQSTHKNHLKFSRTVFRFQTDLVLFYFATQSSLHCWSTLFLFLALISISLRRTYWIHTNTLQRFSRLYFCRRFVFALHWIFLLNLHFHFTLFYFTLKF